MEPTMISLKVLSTAAAMALLLPMAAPSASFARDPGGAGVSPRGGGGAPAARMGGGFRGGGGGGMPAARFSGGGAPGATGGGGGGFSAHGGGGGVSGGTPRGVFWRAAGGA